MGAAHRLLVERVTVLLQLLGRVGQVPGFERGQVEVRAREGDELLVVALGERLRALREVAQEGDQACTEGDEAEEGVDHTERSKAEHRGSFSEDRRKR